MHEQTTQQAQGTPTQEQLQAINRFTRRPLQAQEVYVFPLVLCDNAIDRDLERFPAVSLCKLAKLFVGKTGIFDHDPQGRNQTARVFDTQVVEDPSHDPVEGEPYTQLKAWAYMVRTPENEGLILEIDAGIKKEVSVGCSVKQTCCSICGQNLREHLCEHQLGQIYDLNGQKRLCHRLLVEPTDAYEWSFVAVPAQPQAGVTKQYSQGGDAFGNSGPIPSLLAQKKLEQEAQLGREYAQKLQKDFVRAAQLAQPDLAGELIGAVCRKLTPQELKDWTQAYLRLARRDLPLQVQLSPPEQGERENVAPYQI